MTGTSALAGRRILVTGATSGLGCTLAKTLATEEGAHVIATGRREERLQQLSAEVAALNGSDTSDKSKGSIETHALSLTDRDATSKLCATLTESGIDDLILNAGITRSQPFDQGSFEFDQALLETNVTANLQLIRELLEPLSHNNVGGRILLVASLAGIIPLPYQSVYAGSKAFLVNFGLSLREELKSHGICVLVFAPGGIATEMTDTEAMANMQDQLASPDSVAADAIKMFIARRSLIVPGWQNKLVALLGRLLPRALLASIVGKVYRRAGADGS